MSSLSIPNLECMQYLNPVNEAANSREALDKANNYLNIMELALNSNNLTQVVNFYNASLEKKIFLHITDKKLVNRIENIKRFLIRQNLLSGEILNPHDYLNKIEIVLQQNNFTEAVNLFNLGVKRNIFLHIADEKINKRLLNIKQFLIQQDYLTKIELALQQNNFTEAVKLYNLGLGKKVFLHIADENLNKRLENIRQFLIQQDYLNKIELALQQKNFTKAVKFYDETVEKNIFLHVEKDLNKRLQNIRQFLVQQDLLPEECLLPTFSISIEYKTITESAGKFTAFLLECLKNKKFALARILLKNVTRDQFSKSNHPQTNKMLQELRSRLEESMLHSSERFRRDTETNEIILLPKEASTIASKAAEKTEEMIYSKDAKDDKSKHQRMTTTAASQRTERKKERADSKETKEDKTRQTTTTTTTLSSQIAERKKERDNSNAAKEDEEMQSSQEDPEENQKKRIKTEHRKNNDMVPSSWLVKYSKRYPLMPTEKRQGTDIQGNPINLVFYR